VDVLPLSETFVYRPLPTMLIQANNDRSGHDRDGLVVPG
jgi:hypothetical protein